MSCESGRMGTTGSPDLWASCSLTPADVPARLPPAATATLRCRMTRCSYNTDSMSGQVKPGSFAPYCEAPTELMTIGRAPPTVLLSPRTILLLIMYMKRSKRSPISKWRTSAVR